MAANHHPNVADLNAAPKMNVRKRILLAWVKAVAFTIAYVLADYVWLTSPARPLWSYGLMVLTAALFMTRGELEKFKREVFKTELKWLRAFIWILSLVLVAGTTIMLLGNFRGSEQLGEVGQVLISVGSLGCIAWFIYEDGRLFRSTVS